MRYRDYLRWEGWCSIVLGLELAAIAAPGVVLHYDGWWIGLLFVPATLLALGIYARWRRGVPLTAASRWLTERPLERAGPGRPVLEAAGLRRRLVLETVLWIVAVSAWVLVGARDGLLVFGTGLASVAFGAVQALAAPRRVAAVEAARGEVLRVSRRPGLGTPELAATQADGSTSAAPLSRSHA